MFTFSLKLKHASKCGTGQRVVCCNPQFSLILFLQHKRTTRLILLDGLFLLTNVTNPGPTIYNHTVRYRIYNLETTEKYFLHMNALFYKL